MQMNSPGQFAIDVFLILPATPFQDRVWHYCRRDRRSTELLLKRPTCREQNDVSVLRWGVSELPNPGTYALGNIA